MRISPPLKAVIVALLAGGWIAQADASLAGTLAPAAGAALFTFAWIMFSPAARLAAVRAARPAEQDCCSEQRHDTDQHRISRTPTGRGARDLRCPSSRATARTRRSTRR